MAARHQLAVASLRAVENRRYLVRPTEDGFSAIIDPHGRLEVAAERGTHEALVGRVRLSNATTIYQKVGDAAAWSSVPDAYSNSAP